LSPAVFFVFEPGLVPRQGFGRAYRRRSSRPEKAPIGGRASSRLHSRATMLLTLSAACLRPLLRPTRSGKVKLDLLDLPGFTRETLQLHGLNLSTDLLGGVAADRLEALRERSDKAGCACLLLVESEPQALGEPDNAKGEAVVERLERVIRAAGLLGCNAVGLRVQAKDDAAALAATAERLKGLMERAERLEMNLLISPGEGLCARPERITELIKKVGGFRVGTLPDFQTAAATGDAVNYLRRLTPYASVVIAATGSFVDAASGKPVGPETPLDAAVKHEGYDLRPLVKAIVSVGYDGTLAVDYRGTGDVTAGIARSRKALEDALGAEAGEP
jgi:sugar phosphate isomerase/epimerase